MPNHIVIVHGYTASSQANWFPWLKEELEQRGHTVTVLDMPNPQAPVPDQWDAYLKRAVPECNERTFLVGHSLGCVAILRFLQQTSVACAGGALLVSGFVQPLETLPELTPFVRDALDFEKLRHLIQRRAVLTAVDDDIVSCESSRHLAQQLDAQLAVLPQGGHFIDRDGITQLPEALELLERMMNPL